MSQSRRTCALLTGVSLGALLAGAAIAPAHAAPPAIFSPAWFAARAGVTAGAASLASGRGTGFVPSRQTSADLTLMAARVRQAAAAQITAASLAVASAATRGVPDGLGIGGLQVVAGATAGGTAWQGASLPAQARTAAGHSSVSVTQSTSTAILNWSTFNVGRNTDLSFVQKDSTGADQSGWVVLNRVTDPTGNPSTILGSITAPGHVYVINGNGIIFGAGAQVSVGALIASSAGITDAQLTSLGIYSAASGTTYKSSFTNAASASAVTVEQGALIITALPGAATEGGGSVMLLAGQVSNAGEVMTPQGQTILAAGNSFMLRPGVSTNGNATSTTRGTEIAVFRGGAVANTGFISAPLGDITLVGHSVTQAGVATATTSVNVRGTVHLLTDHSDASASITLAPGSITAVQPDSDGSVAVDTIRNGDIAASATLNALRIINATGAVLNDTNTMADRLDLGRIEIDSGGSVEFAGGSLTMSQGGQIATSAAGRILIDNNAHVDVSGSTTATLSVSSNLLSSSAGNFLRIETNLLRDDPTNRVTGSLSNVDVYVDQRDLITVGATPPEVAAGTGDRAYTAGGLLEVSGFLGQSTHGIDEWTATGGTVTLASRLVAVQSAASINLAGGAITYTGGMVRQSWLVGSDGNLYNVNTAPGSMTYTGLYGGFIENHPHWSITKTYLNPMLGPQQFYEPGYVEGRDAGSLIISAPSVLMNGQVDASVISGVTQTVARPAGVSDGYVLGQNVVPQSGSIAIGDYDARGLLGTFTTAVALGNADSAADGVTVTSKLAAGLLNEAVLNTASLNADGLGGLSIATGGSIAITAGLTLAAGGILSLLAPVVDVGGDISARGGKITISNQNAKLATRVLLSKGEASIAIGAGVTLDARGVWTNAFIDPTHVSGLGRISGGNITLDSTQALRILAGSLIDTSAGGGVLANGRFTGGRGGSVSLLGNDFPSVVKPANVSIGGVVQSYGVIGSGTLTLQAVGVHIASAGTAASGSILLDPAFFTRGFDSYSIDGITKLDVAAGTVIMAVAPTYAQAAVSQGKPTGDAPGDAMQLAILPLFTENRIKATLSQRQGVSLTLSSAVGSGVNVNGGGGVTIGAGASVTVDAGQSVLIDAYGQITIDGAITARGGTIDVVNDRIELVDGSGPKYASGLSVWLGAASRLDVSGLAVTTTDMRARPFGMVTAGGSVTLGSTGGDGGNGTTKSSDALVIVRPGAVVDASGAAASIDQLAGTAGALNRLHPGASSAPLLVASAGGTIALSSNDSIVIDGTLVAAAGGANAAGGALQLTLENPIYDKLANAQPADILRQARSIVISQSAQPSLLSASLRPGAKTPDGGLIGRAALGVDQFAAGGFDSLALIAGDAVLFNGDVSLVARRSISVSEAIIGDSSAKAHVNITSPYVSLSGIVRGSDINGLDGLTISGAYVAPTVTSTGTLTISADLIDIANDVRFGASGGLTLIGGQTRLVSYAGFGNVAFNATEDIRFATSTVASTGNLSFKAAQLFPETQANVVVLAGLPGKNAKANSFSHNGGIITIAGTGIDPQAPLSANGSIIFGAATIDQGGIIRAPEGTITLGIDETSSITQAARGFGGSATQGHTVAVTLEPGSITSVSADGLTIPYGGTTDGQSYSYAVGGVAINPVTPTLVIDSQSIIAKAGATIDLRGGGVLSGERFTAGRGGSVDVLISPLQIFNAATRTVSSPSLAALPVYAIVPSYTDPYAPVTPNDVASGGSLPGVGARITIADGVAGLPAGTYTLLPASYALLPGAFRIQLNPAGRITQAGTQTLSNGSTVVAATLGVANTVIQSTQPIPVTITSGATLRTYATYDEESYAAFETQSAALAGVPRGDLPIDAKTLVLNFPTFSASAPALSYAATGLFQAAPGGYGNTTEISTPGTLEITAPGAVRTKGEVSISAASLDAIGAQRLVVGGLVALGNSTTPTQDMVGVSQRVAVRGGATLTGPEIFIVSQSGGITLDSGAVIDTVGQGAPIYDSTGGTYYSAFGSSAILVSNGLLILTPDNQVQTQVGPITVSDGASIFTDGTLNFLTTQGLSLGSHAHYGARYLTLDLGSLNIGTSAALATAVVPAGFNLSQDVLATLLAGDPTSGAPALQSLTLVANQSVNLYGSVTLSTGGAGGLQELVLETPAIYGYGNAGDVASISTNKLVWAGIEAPANANVTGSVPTSQLPSGTVVGGPGSGKGSLNIAAQSIVLGYGDNMQADNQITLDRFVVGFATVNLTATGSITANNRNALSVYQSQTAYGQPGIGGILNLVTPLLTESAAARLTLNAGGLISILAGGTVAAPAAGALGGQLAVNAASVEIDTNIALPSGQIAITATGGISLGAGARLDVSGRTVGFFDQARSTSGGDVILESTGGSVTQAAGSIIDIAGDSRAGSLSVSAMTGSVVLGGTVSATAGGSIDIHTGTLANFDALNTMLDIGGITARRAFEIGTGNLVVDRTVAANTVAISVDTGALAVSGTIDASGAGPGSIVLAAGNGLTLGAGSLLDAHETALHTDSYGAVIDSENVGHVTLTSTAGTLAIVGGATIDINSPDGVARGLLRLNAARSGADDIAVAIPDPITVLGVAETAVYGWRRYDTSTFKHTGTVTQADLNKLNTIDTLPFMNAVLLAQATGGTIARQTAGLVAAGQAVHLRPGVEIDSATAHGTLTVAGDLNLATFRYGLASEAGAFRLRAGGNLVVNGSITDGFSAPVESRGNPNPDDLGWVLDAGTEPYGTDVVLPQNLLQPIVLGAGTSFSNLNPVSLNYDIRIASATLNADTVIASPVRVAPDPSLSYKIPPAGWVATAAITDSAHNVLFARGAMIPGGTVLKRGWYLAAGTVLPFAITVPDGTTWKAGSSLTQFSAPVQLWTGANYTLTLTGGAFIPAGMNLAFADGSQQQLLRPVNAAGTSQGAIYGDAQLLPNLAGGASPQSWALSLVAGANLVAADPLSLQSKSSLVQAVRSGSAAAGNIVLSDLHYTNPSAVLNFSFPTTSFSVIRTGRNSLDLAAAGNLDELSLYGIYTAGAQSAAITNGFTQQARGLANDGSNTVLGSAYQPTYGAVIAGNKAYYPTGGGDVSITTQGDLRGDIASANSVTTNPSDAIGNWLWRQGNSGITGIANQSTAWWINYGTYVLGLSAPELVGFTGIGTLGGGNITISVGSDAGTSTARNPSLGSQGLDISIAGSGRVVTSGGTASMVQTGGGSMTLHVAGDLNSDIVFPGYDGLNGSLTDLRGNIAVSAGSVGRVVPNYGLSATTLTTRNPFVATVATEIGGVIVVPGDGTVVIETRGDLVLGGVGDAGRLPETNQTDVTLTSGVHHIKAASAGLTSFSLWTSATGISLLADGGDATPSAQSSFDATIISSSAISNDIATDNRFVYPAKLSVVAASGDIFYGVGGLPTALELAPSATGQLDMLAAGSIFGDGRNIIDISGATPSSTATPFAPEFSASRNLSLPDGTFVQPTDEFMVGSLYGLFAFAADTATTALHANDPTPAHIYAATGDITALQTGEVVNFPTAAGVTPTTWYIAGKPVWMQAGRDIVSSGNTPQVGIGNATSSSLYAEFPNEAPSRLGTGAVTTGNLVLNNGSNDISLISAGRDIFESYVYVAGGGELAVEAGRNLIQNNLGLLKSIGPVYNIDTASRIGGASITVTVGAGAAGPDFGALAAAYLTPGNQASAAGLTAPENVGRVAHVYTAELLVWLAANAGYTGDAAGALAAFQALPQERQDEFLRRVFYDELLASGREESNPASQRAGSYVRGKDAIALLFPANGKYDGNIVMSSGIVQFAEAAPQITDSGIGTLFGGDIQLLVPGGQVLLGSTGDVQPGINTGLITFGSGSIQIYAHGSVLLGQSRIFTTFGGGIEIWSATGDIAAGVGAATSLVLNPPQLAYDPFGGYTLSPSAPTSGAGIATLSAIAGVSAGDVDLIAPQGTIDAGEAGIRVSGNLNLAALTIVNASNVQVKGATTGAPTVALANVGALSAASAAAGAAQNAATQAVASQTAGHNAGSGSIITVEVLGYGG